MTSTLVHALLALAVVISATVLRALDAIDTQTVSYVYASAIGFAAGRSGTRPVGSSDAG